ncbi:cell envelope biogenesis protein OmpA [Flavobacterium arcticum]|uniref:Cell envelope biogenesis protein OmpA n=1 Tax=Flavobacterium arcticum TaxID=1784713 RepID=A0A345HBC3_9FLAO|nr:OmpA family protein [Flavobacterium arcticum]AXG73883.1 cell envelope biogenesis protein OmpA [Flavobacterium arcticum]KAF2511834.1 OmpA family protein [Flavobacterium arcticum]
MKQLCFTLTLLLTIISVNAQNKDTETADKLFGRFEYVDAAKEYLKVAKKGKDPYVYKQLAESYYNVFNTKEAIKWYAKATESKQDAETYYRYAQMLKAEGEYEEANKQMQKFAKMAPKDQRAVIFNQDPNYLPKLRNQEKLFDERILDINDDKNADFGAVLANDNTLYFTSARNTSRRKYGRNEEPYLDIYTAIYNEKTGSISEPKPLTDINTKWHDGPVAITADGKTMYFASESFVKGDFDKESTMKQRTGLIYLFVATKQDGKWGNVKPVSFNSNNWSTGNPTISNDGKTLYFTSNREGSIGDTDIWKVEVKGYNSFGEPENLGTKVNTEGKETFPYITDDDKLYFSSNGHKGFGGLDIFMIDLANDGETMNVGAPVNSPQDDFSFSFNNTKNIGFFSSNRKDKDNMYLAIPVCGVEAIVTVKDINTGNPLASAKVAILDDKQNVIETRTTDENGKLMYNVDCERSYSLKTSAIGYETSMLRLPKSRESKIDIEAFLKPIGNLIVDGKVALSDIYFEYNKSNMTPEAAFELDKLVEAMKADTNMVIMVKAHTDNRGSEEYNLNLSDLRARATVQYVISKGIDKSRISGKGYGESELKIDCGENCTEEQHAINRRTEFIIVQ